MKNMTHFKTAVLQIVLIAATFIGATSCKEAQKPEDTKKVAEEHNDAKFNTAKDEKNAQFLVNAAEMDMENIKLGQLAQKNSKMTDVKQLGKMMEEAHTQTLSDINALAKKKLITLPVSSTNDAQAAYTKLSTKAGTAFDKEYCAMMVNGHKDAVVAFEKASTESTDVDIKQCAIQILPDLRTHLDHAITCQKKCEKMK
jgi:putative membrane protein